MKHKPSKARVAVRVLAHSDGMAQNLLHIPAAIAIALFALIVSACTDNTPTIADETGATVEEVEDETSELVGQTVTVSGNVERVLNPQAFIIQDEEFFSDEDVLVVSSTEASLIEDTRAIVTGTVRELTLAEVEQEYDFDDLDLNPELEAELEQRPVIVATETMLAPLVQTLTDNPELFVGREVTVIGEVERVIGPSSFTVDDNDVLGEEDLLVVSANPVAELDESSRVQITGTVRELTTADVEQEFELGPAAEYELYIEDQPAIVADSTELVTDFD